MHTRSGSASTNTFYGLFYFFLAVHVAKQSQDGELQLCLKKPEMIFANTVRLLGFQCTTALNIPDGVLHGQVAFGAAPTPKYFHLQFSTIAIQ